MIIGPISLVQKWRVFKGAKSQFLHQRVFLSKGRAAKRFEEKTHEEAALLAEEFVSSRKNGQTPSRQRHVIHARPFLQSVFV